ncbi:hypothetical protein [Neomicrococcus lactis]|uniref:Lipopolysaccharide export LptBFGC system permease protein LptF n=1 Tax=Neomicrococcus lactis TaxID=732241 RepID=A0A7W8YB46_9MICC|nr:hypothetical protein [Neomicrococcus lactis]MBB5598217.1 lipopolysaccharide export LptBFGC system permease protein LptF [Neomicrococcus lactis]
MYSQGKNKAYSGQGNFAGNFLTLIVVFVLFAAAIFMTTFWTLSNAWWPTIALLVLVLIALIVPQHILGRSDAHPDKTANENFARASVDAEYRDAINAESSKH